MILGIIDYQAQLYWNWNQKYEYKTVQKWEHLYLYLCNFINGKVTIFFLVTEYIYIYIYGYWVYEVYCHT